jgi:hypothetical protein
MAVPATLEPASAAGPGTNEIRIGNTIDYTGPVRAAGVVGKVISAYFDKVNAEGGVNGRRIKFISYDDTYNPAKTVELTRKLIEEDGPLHLCQRRHGNKRSRSILFERKQDSTTVFHFGIVDAGPTARVPLEHGLHAQL